MRIIYIADDGKEFDDKFECENYEWLQNHPYLNDFKCYDKDGKLLEDIVAEETYYCCHKLVVPKYECVKDLCDLAEYTGYCSYSDITNAGIWIFEEKDINGFVKACDYC